MSLDFFGGTEFIDFLVNTVQNKKLNIHTNPSNAIKKIPIYASRHMQ